MIFNSLEYIKDCKNVLQRTENMKDKIKLLHILNLHEQKWDDKYLKEIYSEIKNNSELYNLYTEILYRYLIISESLNKYEIELYGNMLSDELICIDHCKNLLAKCNKIFDENFIKTKS
jgi:hypothetical protein